MPATDEQLAALAREEIRLKQWATTVQFLDIHALEGEEGMPAIAGVLRNCDLATVYFSVQNERFFFAVHFQTEPEPVLAGSGSDAQHAVFFKSGSKKRTLAELAALTHLHPTSGYSLGDRSRFRGVWRESVLHVEPDPGPGAFETKLARLLTCLEAQKVALESLPADVWRTVAVASYYHNGNGCLGGPHLNAALIRRLAALNLDIDFDNYAWGNSYRDE